MTKKLHVITEILLLIIVLCGCSYQPSFQQPRENIMKIDLVHNTDRGQEILHTITEDGIDNFLDDLLELEYYKYNDPLGIPGEWEVWLYYSDGDVDIVGTRTDQYIKNGKWDAIGWHYYEEEDLLRLFDAYLPQPSKAN